MKKCILRHPSFPLNKLDEYYNSENKEAFLLNLFHSSKLFKSTIYLYTPTLFSQVTMKLVIIKKKIGLLIHC